MQLPCAPLPAKFPLWEKSEWRCAGQKHGYYIYYSYQKQCEVTFVGYITAVYMVIQFWSIYCIHWCRNIPLSCMCVIKFNVFTDGQRIQHIDLAFEMVTLQSIPNSTAEWLTKAYVLQTCVHVYSVLLTIIYLAIILPLGLWIWWQLVLLSWQCVYHSLLCQQWQMTTFRLSHRKA